MLFLTISFWHPNVVIKKPQVLWPYNFGMECQTKFMFERALNGLVVWFCFTMWSDTLILK